MLPPTKISLAIPIPPSTIKAPVVALVVSVVALIFTLPVPLAAPTLIVVPAPAKLTVVALVLIRLNDVSSVVILAPLTAKVPARVVLLARDIPPAPVSVKAPALVEIPEAEPPVKVIAPEGVIEKLVIPVSDTAPDPSKSNVAVSSPYLLAPVPLIVTVEPSTVNAPELISTAPVVVMSTSLELPFKLIPSAPFSVIIPLVETIERVLVLALV